MRLRHYLKGLGIGMVVTALILHFSVQAAEPSMTDEEVIARARELGMIENVVLARNDPTISGGSVSGEDAVSTSGNAVVDDGSGTVVDVDQPSDEGETPVDGSGNTDVAADGHDIDPDVSGHENASDVVGNGNASAEDPLEEDITPAAGNDEAETELQEGMAGVEAGQDSNTDTVTVTVSNGDSSVSVAGKLAALGLVSSQAEYDAYLCSHGYDRTIRTGVHVIPVGATEQQIAEIITSKP
ncbi:MAG: hypothetical protein K2K96_05935 [Lachnospiraceae bacterium]|nr:hypothetical protein [Lachnospiraceae bacterium]